MPRRCVPTFIAGINNATVTGAQVLVDASTGQLGIAVSSRRYKEDILPMADVTGMLQKLRPATFHYKTPFSDGSKPLQYGLIAEEVAEVFPDLAVFKDGAPETVKYHLLLSFLLAGYQQQQRTIAAQAAKIEMLEQKAAKVDALEQRLAARSPDGAVGGCAVIVLSSRTPSTDLGFTRDQQF